MEIELGTASINKNQIQIKLHQKYAELQKIDTEELSNKIKTKDYIEENFSSIDKNDYERVLDKFKSMDSNIRIHEQSHASLNSGSSSIHYSYQMGPDGKMYVNCGYTRLNTTLPTDPKQAALKLDEIKKASTASSNMSAADASIARDANLMKIKLAIQEDNKNNII